MLKITKAANGEGKVVFTLSGRMDAENAAELKSLFSQEAKGRRKVLALENLTLVDQDVVSFLERFEVGGLEFQDCPAYLREWIGTERGGSSQQKR